MNLTQSKARVELTGVNLTALAVKFAARFLPTVAAIIAGRPSLCCASLARAGACTRAAGRAGAFASPPRRARRARLLLAALRSAPSVGSFRQADRVKLTLRQLDRNLRQLDGQDWVRLTCPSGRQVDMVRLTGKSVKLRFGPVKLTLST